jgi:ABC-type antimicrobial peptide transport system permease subunit
MKPFTYIFRSIVYYYKQHFTLFLGVAVSAAVLAGALVVGDSIRYSLNKMVDFRLGKTQFAVVSGSRFMDSNLAGKISESLKAPVAPVLFLEGIVIDQETGGRVNNAGIIGIDSSFNSICPSPLPVPREDEVIIGKNLAERLDLEPGDDLLLRVESGNFIPVNAPFARESVPTIALRTRVLAIAEDDQLGRFNLGNDQMVTNNVFVSDKFLGERLDLYGLSNLFLVAGSPGDLSSSGISNILQSQWSFKDMGLSVKRNANGTIDLTSNRVFIDTIVERAIINSGLPQQGITTYLVNDIEVHGAHTPYSFASAVSTGISGVELDQGEVLINQWTAADLNAVPGDPVKLTYYEIGRFRDLREVSRNFIVKDIIDNTSVGINSSLMPAFQGFSEAGSCSDWNAGVPIDLKRIRDKDEAYWNGYRGTPKVILPLETGKEIWTNQFGSLTGIRFNGSEVTEEQLASMILSKVAPSDIGIEVVNVREQGLRAAENAVNFTELFLSMSFFIIVAGILLAVMLYSLHFNRRRSETALLKGLGFSAKKILWLRFSESLFVIGSGSIVGTFLGLLYNRGLIAGLNTLWNDIVRTDVLMVNVEFNTLLISFLISIIVALLPLFVVTSRQIKKSIAGQLKEDGTGYHHRSPANNKAFLIPGVLLAFALLLVTYSIVTGAFNNALLYLSSATLVLVGSVGLFYILLRRPIGASDDTFPSIQSLAVKNLQRNPARSLSVIILLALGTFTIILTGSYRKTFHGTESHRSSGTGGYLLWAETSSPVVFDLNSEVGKNRLIVDSLQQLEEVQFLQFSRLEGDEASCLNLNQVQRPRLLAVDPQTFDSAGAFTIVERLPFISEEHPWPGLNTTFNDSTFVAYVDQTVLQYSLQKKLGDTLVYRNEYGKPLKLILAGALNNTIFQGNILVSGEVLRSQFPSLGGSKTILIDASVEKQAFLTEVLSESLVDYGIEITTTSQRLANFYSVTNTYLSVFMALSGLGFIIGTIGLGIILLRNVNERRKELALLMAIGYSRNMIFKIVFTENFILLITGSLTGILAAVIGILPSLLSPAFDLEGTFLFILITGIFINGLIWIYFPLRSALRKPLIPDLRND